MSAKLRWPLKPYRESVRLWHVGDFTDRATNFDFFALSSQGEIKGSWTNKITQNTSGETMLQELKKSNSAIFAISDKEQIKSEKSILELVEELKVLNQRWEKSNQLDESGFYLNKSPEYQERVCTELRKICSRATDIWEYLAEVSPERLEGLYLLEKID